MKPKQRWALVIAVAGWSASAQAAEPDQGTIEPEELKQMDIEQLAQVEVSTVSRLEERLDWAPGTIYVYSREVIQQRGYRSLGELLQTVPGFTVFHRDTQFVVGVRGLNANDNDKMSLLINGQRVLGLHEQELLNGPINLDNVKRVEVVVGPSSLFQQADTLAATVNVITLNVDGVEVLAATGTDLPYSATLMLGKRWDAQRFVSLSFTSEMKQGFDAWTNPSRPFLPGRDLTGRLNFPSYFGVLAGQYHQWAGQVVAYRSSWPELWIDGADPRNDGTYLEEFYSGQVEHEHRWSDRLISVASLDIALRRQIRSNEGGPPINATSQSVQQWQYRLDASLRYTRSGHHVQAGVQASVDDNFDTFFTFDDTSGTNNVHIPRTTIVDDDTFAIGFYLDDEFDLSRELKLVAGVRVDHNQRLDGNGWFPGWRTAVVYQPIQSWITKLAFYRAVRMPSPFEALNEVFGTNNPDSPNKPAFANLSPTANKPELLTTLELQNIVYLGPVRLAATVYHQWLDDFITWFQPHSNGGDFRGTGAELSVQAPIEPRLTLWGNGAWNDSKLKLFRPEAFGTVDNTPENVHAYVNADDRIIGSARYTANLGFDSEFMRDLKFSPSLRYFTEQAALDFHPPAEGGPRFMTLRGRVYLDATLSWRRVPLPTQIEIDLRASVYNILNNRDKVGAQLFGDTYRPRGISAVFALDLRY